VGVGRCRAEEPGMGRVAGEVAQGRTKAARQFEAAAAAGLRAARVAMRGGEGGETRRDQSSSEAAQGGEFEGEPKDYQGKQCSNAAGSR
jgi:hypothetical protein